MLSLRRLAALTVAGTGAALVARAALRRRAFHFTGRVVVVTGGSRGLGLVLARELAEQGARLVLLARDAQALDRAKAELDEVGAEVLAIPCDVRDAQAVRIAIRRAAERFGRIDVLVNNAGVMQAGPVEHMQVADFEDAMATNFFGALHASLAAIPRMLETGGGRIVNICSIGGKVAVPHMLPYTASKFALVGFSDGLRAEVARYGIRVTTVCPGLMRTGSPINVSFKGDAAKEFAWFAFSDRLPFLSMSARTAARRILEACRRGSPRLLLSAPTKAAVVADLMIPSVVTGVLALVNRFVLPKPVGPEGDLARKGYEVGEPDRDAFKNNEMPSETRTTA